MYINIQYEQIDLECKKLSCNLFSSKHSWRSTAAYLKREVVRNHTRSRYDDYAMRMVGDSLWSRAWDKYFEMGLIFFLIKSKLSPACLQTYCLMLTLMVEIATVSKTDETFTSKVSRTICLIRQIRLKSDFYKVQINSFLKKNNWNYILLRMFKKYPTLKNLLVGA